MYAVYTLTQLAMLIDVFNCTLFPASYTKARTYMSRQIQSRSVNSVRNKKGTLFDAELAFVTAQRRRNVFDYGGGNIFSI